MEATTGLNSEQMTQFKQQVWQEWSDERTVNAWDKWHSAIATCWGELNKSIVAAAQLQPGMQVLDLAGGSGEPALSLAAAVGASGHVTMTDLVPGLVAAAQRKAQEQGLGNISFQEADAEALPFDDASFDVVTSRLGIMFFPNTAQALSEIKRVLKVGGRLALVTWGAPAQNQWFSTTLGVSMKELNTPPPNPEAPGPFRFANPDKLAAALTGAGFEQVEVETKAIDTPFPGTAEDLWSFVREIGAPFRRVFSGLTDEQKDQLTTAVYNTVRPLQDGQRLNLSGSIVVASAVR